MKIRVLLVAFLPGALKSWAYRTMFGARIGKGARIGFGSLVDCRKLTLEEGASIGALSRIRADELYMGKRARIENFANISVHRMEMRARAIVGSRVAVSGKHLDKRSSLFMGMRAWVFQDCFLDVTRPVHLGRTVGLGGGSYIFTHGSWLPQTDGFPVVFAPVRIEDNVWLPWGCFIMPGVTIGSNSVIGARSVVNKDVPAGALVAGVPARVIREKSYVPVSDREKLDILAEATRDYAGLSGQSVEVRESAQTFEILLSGRRLILTHRRGTDPMPPAADALNVFFQHPGDDVLLRHPSITLDTYASSPEALLRPEWISWLDHLSGIGVRYFPVDES